MRLVYREQQVHCTERVAREDSFHALALIDAEVASTIRDLLRAGPAVGVSAERAEEMLDDFSRIPITRYPMLPFLRGALNLREDFTIYDTLYLVLARTLDGRLLTADSKFAKAPVDTDLGETWE